MKFFFNKVGFCGGMWGILINFEPDLNIKMSYAVFWKHRS